MTPTILALFAIVCTNPPDANGNLTPDCLAIACPNTTKDIAAYQAQKKKLSTAQKADLASMIHWHTTACKGRG